MADFVRLDGAPLFEIVSFLSGKELGGKVAKFSTNKREYVQQLVAQYNEVGMDILERCMCILVSYPPSETDTVLP